MTTTAVQKSPLELLEKQTRLIQSVSEMQAELLEQQRETTKLLTKWLGAMLEEQRKQSKHLSTISAGVVLFVILTLLGLVIGFCSGAGYF